jgi:hypothetical protein
MNCPNCGAPEKARVKVCHECDQAYASQDLLELRQLEYLIEATDTWKVADSLRSPYLERLEKLRSRLRREPLKPDAVEEAKPAITPTPAIPYLVPKEKTTIFRGPGTHYPGLGFVSPGKNYKLIGVSRNKAWWVIKVPTTAAPDGQGWIRTTEVTAFNAQDMPVIQAPPVPTKVVPKPAVAKPKPAPPAPPKEKMPFDQWLLSERNIKIALYTGGLLLLIAGIIFIGVNWTRIPGPGKFGITLLVTGLMYLGGYLLMQRSAYRIGGVALLGIASGFFVLNFAVLQIYVLGPRGLPDDVMWLIASPFCLLLYMLTAYWTKSDLFTYLSVAAVGSSLTAGLVVAGAPELVFWLAFALLSLALLLLARGVKNTQLASFTYQPLTIISNILMPSTYLGTLFYIFLPLAIGNPWFKLPILGIGTIFYFLSAYWYRNKIFMFASLVSIGGIAFSIMFLLQAPILVYPLVYSILAYSCLILARVLRDSSLEDFTRLPLLLTSQIVTPLMIIFTVMGWLFHEFIVENPWLSVATLGVAILFYITTDVLFKRLEARWATAILFPTLFGITLFELNVNFSDIGIAFMVLALVYLGLGYALAQRENRKAGGWPFYATSYGLAALVTFLAFLYLSDLVIILFADVLMLVISAAIHRVYWWVYGAVWLFMLPVYLTISLYINELHNQGLFMGVLGLNYVLAGYILGRRRLQLGGPFLTAAAFLSVVTVALTWTNPLTATLVIPIAAALYLLIAVWLGWSWLLLPVLVLINLTALSINILLFGYQAPIDRALIISYGILGVVFTLGALVLRRRNQDSWSWPLYLIGGIDVCGAYLASFVSGGWLAVGISSVMAILSLSFAWLGRAFLEKQIKFPLLTYIGVAVIFIGHFYALVQILGEGVWNIIWPVYTAGLCALFITLAWMLRQETVVKLYSIPLRRAGLLLMVIPLVGSIAIFVASIKTELNPIIVAVTFGIAGVTFTSDAVLRRFVRQAYLGIGAFMVVIWAVLLTLEVSEAQSYILPIGFTLLGVGWYERSQGESSAHKILTYSGLILLMGSSFIQSIPRGAYVYAILLGFESLLALAWGMRSHCRCYVQVGGLALIANAIVQLGPGFIDLPRWIQIGVTGAILLGGGLAALFKREQILTTRKRLTDEWRQWNP